MTPVASILHLDLDAFYASVEQLADPTLRGKPVVVGGLGPRGVVAAASYEARPYGIQSAMPMARARRACPHAVFLAPRFEAYGEASAQVMKILRDVTPLVEPIALDEAFLDVSGAGRLHGTPVEIAVELRRRIRTDTGLVASVGVATTKMMAKLASDLAKPDGLLVVEPGTELDVLHPLDVTRLWGVGPATRRRLERLGVSTVGDLAALSVGTLTGALGQAHGTHLHDLAWNRDTRAVDPNRELKSVGHEETFPRDVHDRDVLAREARRMAETVAERLRKAGRAGRTVQLKLRYSDFRTITRSRTLPEATDTAADLAAVAVELLGAVELGNGIRLLGVTAQQLEETVAVQTRLDLEAEPGVVDGFAADHAGARAREGDQANTHERTPDARARRRAVEVSVDEVRGRFGADAVERGRGGRKP